MGFVHVTDSVSQTQTTSCATGQETDAFCIVANPILDAKHDLDSSCAMRSTESHLLPNLPWLTEELSLADALSGKKGIYSVAA